MPLPLAAAVIIASALAAGAHGAGSYASSQAAQRAAKRRAKETKRETQASMLNDAAQREAELGASNLESRKKLGQRKATSMQNTADLVRGAFNI